uniref:Uncharacterized protein n=1 Tax=Pelusios castaneus TaxID=367368 RepID=A0A8C8RGD2_9SAUR
MTRFLHNAVDWLNASQRAMVGVQKSLNSLVDILSSSGTTVQSTLTPYLIILCCVHVVFPLSSFIPLLCAVSYLSFSSPYPLLHWFC